MIKPLILSVALLGSGSILAATAPLEPGKTALGENFYTHNYHPSLLEQQQQQQKSFAYDWQFTGGYQEQWQNWRTFLEAGAAASELSQPQTPGPISAYQLVSGISYQWSNLLLTSRVRQVYTDVNDTQLELSSAYRLLPSLSMLAEYGLTQEKQQAVKLGVSYHF